MVFRKLLWVENIIYGNLIFEFANLQMSFQDLKRPGREMLNNICLAGLRILSIMVIWVGVSLDLWECDISLALDTN